MVVVGLVSGVAVGLVSGVGVRLVDGGDGGVCGMLGLPGVVEPPAPIGVLMGPVPPVGVVLGVSADSSAGALHARHSIPVNKEPRAGTQ